MIVHEMLVFTSLVSQLTLLHVCASMSGNLSTLTRATTATLVLSFIVVSCLLSDRFDWAISSF